MQQSNIESFQSLSQFTSIHQFNNHIEQWMIDYKSIFSPSETLALKRLIRFSSKIFGVCNARINTILEAIKDKDCSAGVSRSTFKRMLSKAKEIGLLVVKETVRQNHSQSSNLYIFQPYATNEPPQTEGEQVEVPTEQQEIDGQLDCPNTINLSKTNIKDIRTVYVDQFEKYASIFFHDYKTIRELRKISIIHSRINSICENQAILLSLECLKVLLAKMKSKPISNVFGFYNGICKNE
jgi:hypothetical protein